MPATSKDFLAVTACLLGFSAVALGAFGAHALKETLEATNRIGTWETAAHYHLVHAVAILLFAHLKARKAAWVMALGVVIFSGSLYLLAGLDIPALGAVTPLGGVVLLISWAMAAWQLSRWT